MSHARLARWAVLFVPVLCACGGGGEAPSGALAPPFLQIATREVPRGTTEAPYESVQLEAQFAVGEVTWHVYSGALPPGLVLSSSGQLTGTPTETGEFFVIVQATDSQIFAQQDYTFEIADFAPAIVGGLVGDAAWTEAPVYVSAAGSTRRPLFGVIENRSGGRFEWTNEESGQAIWLPGTVEGGTDTLQVTDTGTGFSETLSFRVLANPAPTRVAEFGTTDVWWIETNVKNGAHDYPTDLQAAFGELGLVPAAPLSSDEQALAYLVESAFRLQILRDLNEIYLREADGTAGSDGLAISFPFICPDPFRYAVPRPGQTFPASTAGYSVLQVTTARGDTASGRAFLDFGNDSYENNGGGHPNGRPLGVYCDYAAISFGSWQTGRVLTGQPVGLADLDVVLDILYERPSSGARHDAIELLIVGFARFLCATAAHEVGHSVGLEHNDTPDTLMSTVGRGWSEAALSAANAFPLTADEIDLLRTSNLPGPGR